MPLVRIARPDSLSIGVVHRPGVGSLWTHNFRLLRLQLPEIDWLGEISGRAEILTECLVPFVFAADNEYRDLLRKAQRRKRPAQLETRQARHR